MSIHYREQGSALIVLGNTYPYRDQLKALGARFNGADKNWRLPVTPETLRQVAELCVASGGGSLGEPTEARTAFPDMSAGAAAASSSLSPLPGAPAQTAAPTWAQPLPAARPMRTTTLAPYSGPVPSLPSLALQDPPPLARAPSGSLQAAPAGEQNSLTIRQLMESLERAMSIAFPQALWVTGEVQNLSRKGSGIFFDLAEGRSDGHANATITVRAIIWQGVLKGVAALRGADVINDVLQDGMKIRCLVQVQLYKDRGSVSLLVTDIDPSYTKGALALAREKLLKELRAKGLDQANKRLPMPAFPLRLGLISADGSRAKSDFLDQLMSLGYPGDVLFCSCVMQGEQVPKQIGMALARLQAAGCDLIVMTRGGGSAADLRWFDAADIAYAIAGARVPIIAAIGHHDDVCVAEEVCHLRQKTPTAAADYVVSLILDTRNRIDSLAQELAKALDLQVESLQRRLASAAEKLSGAAKMSLEVRTGHLTQRIHYLQRSTNERIEARSTMLLQRGHVLQRAAAERLNRLAAQAAEVKNALERASERRLSGQATQLLTLESQLGRLDPSGWLAQGWTQLSGPSGRVRQIADVGVGEAVTARLADGWLALHITAKNPSINAVKAEQPEAAHD